MEIIRTRPESKAGPAEWFTGEVWFDEIAAAALPSWRLHVLSVHFSPGARTAWHSHPNGQLLHVTDGAGLVQRRGEPVEAIRPGDIVRIEADEEHWHGAAPDRLMTHLALQEVDDEGASAHWGKLVSEEEYLAGS